MLNQTESEYWRKVWRNARRFRVGLEEKKFCNHWHQHFDWGGRGNKNKFEHRKHLRPLFHAFVRAQNELKIQGAPFQIFLSIHPTDTGSDALYVHTPNPYTDFPAELGQYRLLTSLPALLVGFVDLEKYQLGVGGSGKEKWYVVIPIDPNKQLTGTA